MIRRREFLRDMAVGVGAAVMGKGCSTESNLSNAEGMNVLFLIAEDAPREALQCYGNRAVKTPNLDAFAQTGVQFNNAYCQAPVCNPSRTSFVTGVRTDKTNVWRNGEKLEERMPGIYLTMPEYFKEHGFYTCTVGKFFHHNYHANKQANAWMELERSALPQDYKGLVLGNKLYDPETAPPNPKYDYQWDDNPKYEAMIQKAYDGYITERSKHPEGSEAYYAARKPFQIAQMYRVGDSMDIPERSPDGIKARMAAARLRQFAQEKRRFFMSVNTGKPHTPLLCPKKYLDMYPLQTVRTSTEGAEKDVGVPKVARRNDVEEFGPNQFYGTEQEALQAFYGCCSFVDEQFGIVLNTLRETGLDKNTIVVFFGDHGFMTGQHSLWCKHVLFEQSTGIPFIVRVPGASENGTQCDDIVELVDLFPTLYDLLGLPELPYPIDGESLQTLIHKNDGLFSRTPDRRKKNAYTTIAHGTLHGYSVRHAQYRYSEYIRKGVLETGELYDLKTDPYEHINQISNPEYKEVVNELAAMLSEAYPDKNKEII